MSSRYDPTSTSRVPVRPPDYAIRQSPRILVLCMFVPWDPIKMVHGVVQRLVRHLRALDQLGPIDLAIFSL